MVEIRWQTKASYSENKALNNANHREMVNICEPHWDGEGGDWKINGIVSNNQPCCKTLAGYN